MEEEKKFKDPFDGEYIGNIWGWKFSFIGLGVILFMFGLIVYRHYTLDVPVGFEDPLKTETTIDSTTTKNE